MSILGDSSGVGVRTCWKQEVHATASPVVYATASPVVWVWGHAGSRRHPPIGTCHVPCTMCYVPCVLRHASCTHVPCAMLCCAAFDWLSFSQSSLPCGACYSLPCAPFLLTPPPLAPSRCPCGPRSLCGVRYSCSTAPLQHAVPAGPGH